MRKMIAIIMIGGLIAGFGATADAAKKKKKPKPAGPVTVFTDPAGDTGINNGAAEVPQFSELGVDLAKGIITKSKKGDAVEFRVEHHAMPSVGSFPEGARILWHFTVGAEEYRFTVKTKDIGKPDVTAQSGTERVGQVYLDGVFRLEQCTVESVGINLSQCVVTAYLDGVVDPATKSISWSVPLKTIKAKKGSVIAQGSHAAGDTCPICWVPHYGERSLTPTTIIDGAIMTTSYKVP